MLALKNILVFLLIVGHEKNAAQLFWQIPCCSGGLCRKKICMEVRVALFCGLVEKLELYIKYMTNLGSLFKILNKNYKLFSDAITSVPETIRTLFIIWSPVFLFNIFSRSLKLSSHERNWDKKKPSNYAKLQFLNEKKSFGTWQFR